MKMADYTKLREEQKTARKEGRLMGIGVSTYVEICALGPSPAMPAGGWESATVRMEPTGKVTVLTGASPHGQGEETSFAQIAADELGVGVNDVTVIHGDTAIVQYGIGTFGSRGLAVGGTAVYMAIQKLKDESGENCGAYVAVREGVISPTENSVRVGRAKAKCRSRRCPSGQAPAAALPEPHPGGKTVTMQDIALEAHIAKNLPVDMEPGLSATSFFEPKNFTFPFGTHIAVVEIDPETGEIHFQRYIAVDDCGKQINPMLVEGQIHGGIVQAWARPCMKKLFTMRLASSSPARSWITLCPKP